MSEPSRSDMRLYERALRQGWHIPTELRTEIIEMMRTIMVDTTSTRRDRTAAARVLLQADRVELDAIRVAQGAQYEDLVRRLRALEGEDRDDGGLAKVSGGA
jgi:hypothetical protein